MKTLRLIAACLLLLGLPPVVMLWRHTIVSGRNPARNVLLALVFLLLAIPPVMWLFKILRSPMIGRFSIRPDTWFALGAVVLLVLSFDPGGIWRHSSLDFHWRDTYYVISKSSVAFAMAIWFGLLAIVYFIFARFAGRRLQDGLGYIHFWSTALVVDFILFPDQYVLSEPGPNGIPKLYFILGMLAQILLPVNILLSHRTTDAP